MMQGKKIAALVMIGAATAGMTTSVFAADSTFDMRRRVVNMLGVIATSRLDENVTREEFARMLVRASEYRSMAQTTSNVSVFADVPSNGEYAASIRLVADNDWMSAYLGGNFKPQEPVAMRDAIRAALGLLGYTNADFSGNLREARRAKFSSLALDSNISRGDDEVLTYTDCINLFYNLMKADRKDGGQYGSRVFELTYNEDGEVNLSSILDNSLKGPKIIENRNLKDVIPFSLTNATLFLDGETALEGDINDAGAVGAVVYYHEATKMVFAYSDSKSNESSRGASVGRIHAIYYDASDPFTATEVELNTDRHGNANGYDSFKLSGTELQYLFSVYGDFEVGDEVAIVWERSGNEDNATYTVVDVVGNY